MKHTGSADHHYRVDVINRYFYPVTSGIETSIMEVYSSLAKMGWQVVIHTSRNTLTQKNILLPYARVRGSIVKRDNFYRYSLFPSLDWHTADVISLHNFDILPHFFVLLHSLFLKKLARKRFILVLTPHSGFNPDWRSFPKLQAIVKKIYHDTIGTFLINHAVDAVQAISEWEKHELTTAGIKPSLITLIQNGSQAKAFDDTEKRASHRVRKIAQQAGSYMIQVGRIHPIKNYETAIAAMTKIPESLKFIIVGPEQDIRYKQQLLDLISTLKLGKRVLFCGVVNDTDKYYLLKHAELMVHMATHEGYCLAVVEGFSQRLVCIVSNRTALPYVVKNGVNGYCVDWNDYQGVAEKIRFVLAHKQSKFIKDMQQRNRDFARNHSWETAATRILSLYTNLLLPRT